jgi:uncharacterized membrane protein
VTKPQESQRASATSMEERVRRVELLISDLLRSGVLISLTLITVGTVVSFIHHPEYLSSSTALQRLTAPGAAFPHTLFDVWSSLKDLQGQAIVTVGLLLLIATPVIRVAVSIFAFIYQHDRTYTVITLVVLCLLLLSFVLGKVE